jgi:hypothetical protein
MAEIQPFYSEDTTGIPGAPGAQTSSEKTAENLDLLIGSLGVSGSLYAAGPVPQRDLSTGYPQLIC